MYIKYDLINKSKGSVQVSSYQNVYEFFYPCENSSDCTDYSLILSPGFYKFEAYGASGGIPSSSRSSTYLDPKTNKCNDDMVHKYRGNSQCYPNMYSSGAGGYVSATLYLKKETRAYLMIGGQGTYLDYVQKDWNYIPGGYGGGGYAIQSPEGHLAASGGGKTSLMFLDDDIFHSVLVSGAGGGCDDFNEQPNDGKGGAGGGLIAQSFWQLNTGYNPDFEINNNHFFTYGSGESSKLGSSSHLKGSKSSISGPGDYCGAGSGWYGGFVSFYSNAGCSGGSSFVLANDAIIPDEMTVHDTFYLNPITDHYAFVHSSEYMMSNVTHAPGIWIGNGMFRFTLISYNQLGICITMGYQRCVSNILLKIPLIVYILT